MIDPDPARIPNWRQFTNDPRLKSRDLVPGDVVIGMLFAEKVSQDTSRENISRGRILFGRY